LEDKISVHTLLPRLGAKPTDADRKAREDVLEKGEQYWIKENEVKNYILTSVPESVQPLLVWLLKWNLLNNMFEKQ
jgi:hypothetical protein